MDSLGATVEPVLRVDGLVRRFGERIAVDGVGFTVAPGEIYGLLGPNGAGKTTTIRLVCGLLRAEVGSVRVAGRVVDGTDPSARSAIGYVPQEIALYPDLSARENLRFFGRLYGLAGRRLRGRIDATLELTGLSDRADDRVESFSGGMKRRLNIGAGLLHEPRLLVLDEPTVGVDPQSRHALLDSVLALREQGMGVLYTTHYMEEAEKLCDRVGIMDHGRLVAEGTRRELVAKLGQQDRISLSASGDLSKLAAACRTLPGVGRADVADGQVLLLADEARRLLPDVIEAADRAGIELRSVDVREPDLEAVFLHLTGTALRE